MKILLFGVTGLIGTAISDACIEKDTDCIGLSHSDIEATNTEELKNSIDDIKPDVIVNAIGIPSPKFCEENPIEAFKINSILPFRLTNICSRRNIILIHISSHAVFDGTKDRCYVESDVPSPINTYGISKYAAEIYIQANCSKYYIMRLPTIYGLRKNGKKGITDKFLSWLKEGKEIKIATDRIDSFSYNKDIAYEILRILKICCPYGIYHIANYGSTNFYDFVLKMKYEMGSKSFLKEAKDMEFSLIPNPLKTGMISTKLNPLRKWEDALHDYLFGL